MTTCEITIIGEKTNFITRLAAVRVVSKRERAQETHWRGRGEGGKMPSFFGYVKTYTIMQKEV